MASRAQLVAERIAPAIVVLTRTFLSFTLELESSGRWPWRKELRPEHRHA